METEEAAEDLLAGQLLRVSRAKQVPIKKFDDSIADLRRGMPPWRALQAIPQGYKADGYKLTTILSLYFPMRAAQINHHEGQDCECV
jgi:hypothetical protein